MLDKTDMKNGAYYEIYENCIVSKIRFSNNKIKFELAVLQQSPVSFLVLSNALSLNFWKIGNSIGFQISNILVDGEVAANFMSADEITSQACSDVFSEALFSFFITLPKSKIEKQVSDILKIVSQYYGE
tara:strand:- start:6321 stop:6707 length:387 start_codon:yes stop_codon:yes gene_type:complete